MWLFRSSNQLKKYSIYTERGFALENVNRIQDKQNDNTLKFRDAF